MQRYANLGIHVSYSLFLLESLPQILHDFGTIPPTSTSFMGARVEMIPVGVGMHWGPSPDTVFISIEHTSTTFEWIGGS